MDSTRTHNHAGERSWVNLIAHFVGQVFNLPICPRRRRIGNLPHGQTDPPRGEVSHA